MSKWGDEELDEGVATGAPAETAEDLKTIVEVKTNDKGEKVKVTRVVREYTAMRKVNKRVEERRKVPLVSLALHTHSRLLFYDDNVKIIDFITMGESPR